MPFRKAPAMNWNTSNVKYFDSMFSGCQNLVEAPMLDTSNGISFTQMFYQCTSLKKIPSYDFSKGTRFTWLFYGAPLEELPALDFSSATELGSGAAFSNIVAKTMPVWKVGKSLISFSVGMPGMRYVPEIDFSQSLLTSFSIGGNLVRCKVKGLRCSHSYQGRTLSRAALVEIFTNLGVVNNNATITVTSNYGTADLTAEDIAIATAKGWTVAY